MQDDDLPLTMPGSRRPARTARRATLGLFLPAKKSITRTVPSFRLSREFIRADTAIRCFFPRNNQLLSSTVHQSVSGRGCTVESRWMYSSNALFPGNNQLLSSTVHRQPARRPLVAPPSVPVHVSYSYVSCVWPGVSTRTVPGMPKVKRPSVPYEYLVRYGYRPSVRFLFFW